MRDFALLFIHVIYFIIYYIEVSGDFSSNWISNSEYKLFAHFDLKQQQTRILGTVASSKWEHRIFAWQKQAGGKIKVLQKKINWNSREASRRTFIFLIYFVLVGFRSTPPISITSSIGGRARGFPADVLFVMQRQLFNCSPTLRCNKTELSVFKWLDLNQCYNSYRGEVHWAL